MMIRTLMVATAAACTLAACSSGTSSSGSSSAPQETTATTVTVTSNGSSCDLSSASASAGPVTFEVVNQGSDVTEFYLYAHDGTTIVGEVEDVTPGTTRDLSVDANPGKYVAACKPTSDSEGIRVDFTVN
ncbi:MAG: cupredoxin domain-containing protein [Candidatus Nanopelagicales bacterium]